MKSAAKAAKLRPIMCLRKTDQAQTLYDPRTSEKLWIVRRPQKGVRMPKHFAQERKQRRYQCRFP